MHTCSNAPVSGVPAIQPKHAVSLIPGDIVKLHPSDRRRVVTVADTGAAFVTGEWEVLTGPTPRREPFTAAFCRFFTVETQAVAHV